MYKYPIIVHKSTMKLTLINLTNDLYVIEGGCDVNGSAFTALAPGRHEICFCNSHNFLNSVDVLGTFGIDIWNYFRPLTRIHYINSEIIIIHQTNKIRSLFILASSVLPTKAIAETHLRFTNTDKLIWTHPNKLLFPITYYSLACFGWICAYTCKCIGKGHKRNKTNQYCAHNKTPIPYFTMYEGPSLQPYHLGFWGPNDNNDRF